MMGLVPASLLVMTPWPLLGLLGLHAHFDRATEWFVLLGGVTMFPLPLVALFASPSEEVTALVVTLVSWRRVGGLLGAQSLFALPQAVMGALLVLGKDV
jgi:hypothetical protein